MQTTVKGDSTMRVTAACRVFAQQKLKAAHVTKLFYKHYVRETLASTPTKNGEVAEMLFNEYKKQHLLHKKNP